MVLADEFMRFIVFYMGRKRLHPTSNELPWIKIKAVFLAALFASATNAITLSQLQQLRIASYGNSTRNLSGNATGNITGNATGNATGNISGNATGNISGNASGNA